MIRQRLLVLVVALALVVPLFAQQQPPADAAPPASEAPPAESPPADAAPADAPPAGAGSGGAAESRRAAAEEDNDFVPTEEVPPDEEVVFPVDF